MLERILEIQGIGLLHNANGKSHSCKKATLIYADNGRGKSTLTSILRSVSTGEAWLITTRKTLDGILPPKVILQFGSGHKVMFENGSWTKQRPEVLVFDADFVERNVHSGGTVSTGHRKSLLEFALGEPAVAAREEVEKATGKAKEADGNVQKLTGQLFGYHGGMNLAQFEKLPQVTDIDLKIIEIQKRISAARNVAAILARPVPIMVAEPSFNIDSLFMVLTSSLENVHKESELLVRQHIAKLGRKKGAESWLSQGGQFDDSELCPYCGQSTSGVNLIRAYRTHFNAEYNKLKDMVAAVYNYVDANTVPGIVDRIEQSVDTASALARAWAEYVPTEMIAFDVDSARAALDKFQSLVLNLSLKKKVSPAERMGTEEEKEEAVKLWQSVVAPIKTANLAINKAIKLINTYKAQLNSEDVIQLQQQEKLLQVAKERYSPQVVELFIQLSNARTAVVKAENSKKTAREKLDALMTETLRRYEKSINDHLKNFGASFSIKGMCANFRGAGPRSEYGLLLRGKDVPLEGGPPSFATALSEGDKRTLAFAFFIASTLADAKLATRIVVIDDPMCSLDLNRKHQTRTVLKKIYSKADQLIVLAHDPYFIRDLRDKLYKDDKSSQQIALFQLAPAPGDYTDFALLDIDRECESIYFQHHRLLNDFAGGKGGDPRSVAKAIRPMLEGYLHRRFPCHIPKSLLFGQVVDCIRNAVAPSPLCYAAGLVDELNEINDYAGQFHHDTNPGGAEAVVITASELKTFVDRALAVVHGNT
jgi:wobble nucleotide-excising tRNase